MDAKHKSGETPTDAQNAREWEAVARNLAQVLEVEAMNCEEAGKLTSAWYLRGVFRSQCEAHGLTP